MLTYLPIWNLEGNRINDKSKIRSAPYILMPSEYRFRLVEDIDIERKRIRLKSWGEVIGTLLGIRIYEDEITVSISIYERVIYDLVLYEEKFNPIKNQIENSIGKRIGILRTD